MRFLCRAMVTLVMVSLGACAAPASFQRPDVSADLTCRTGLDLGPPTPPCEPLIPDAVDWQNGITQDEAAVVALWNNPGYQRLLADLDLARAEVIAAHEIRNPQITTMFPISVKQWELAMLVPLDAIMLRPWRTEIAQVEASRTGRRLVQDGLNVVRDARVAHADALLAERVLELAERGLQLREETARVAEARLRAGEVSDLDVATMRLEASIGRQQVIQAERDADLAQQRLRFVLGLALVDAPIDPVAELTPVEPLDGKTLDAETLVAEAVQSRPDLRATSLAVDAAEQRAQLAKYDYFGFFGMLPDINSKGIKGFEAGPGAQFLVPIFNWNQGAKSRFRANAEQLRRTYAEQRDMAALEVRQAAIRLMQAEAELQLWREEVLPQAETSVKSAQQALQEDAVPLLLVLETNRQLISAKQQELQAEAEVRRAVAELERSVGRTLFAAAPQAMLEELPRMEALPEAEADGMP